MPPKYRRERQSPIGLNTQNCPKNPPSTTTATKTGRSTQPSLSQGKKPAPHQRIQLPESQQSRAIQRFQIDRNRLLRVQYQRHEKERCEYYTLAPISPKKSLRKIDCLLPPANRSPNTLRKNRYIPLVRG